MITLPPFFFAEENGYHSLGYLYFNIGELDFMRSTLDDVIVEFFFRM